MFGIFKKKQAAIQPATQEVSIPAEIISFLNAKNEFNSEELQINILDAKTSAQKSHDVRSVNSGKHLGLVVLNDIGDSNPYCYITEGIATGMVVHFNHDPEPKIEFASLNAFEEFLRKLHVSHTKLGELEIEDPVHPNQAALSAVLSELARATEFDDSEFLICLYLPLLRGEHEQVLQNLAEHPSFFVREAVADAIGSAHLTDSTNLILSLIKDPHPQVQNAALRVSKLFNRSSFDVTGN
ncbi:hypothetical protein H8K47_09070 [Undibacterium sp. CY7W]|uniref:HEAT repeat protein n=1 Tax=Undibacterium rugosum TaxID=2762291 RepID=A0A923KZQ6_9BURK|nr:HEAT repeat domain-containing protein [Undibacterium rugosum]MBC3935511.1 hypothetical protein [Undibacterium rugosum]